MPNRSSSSLSEDAYPPGTVLGERYRIVALIGKGGMGEVYLADDLVLEQRVALKFLPDTLAAQEGGLERFRAEARLARSVTHPNVARVHDIVRLEDRHFLSMEYVDGENLQQLLRRIGRLPAEKALDIARQLCAGLAAAHDQGVLHRDLKPANVMLDGRGRVRITDFGLSALIAEGARGGGLVGTPAYMAPEQIRGQPTGLRSDLYSLGLVLYELFTGQAPFPSGTFGQSREYHLHQPPPRPSSIIPDMDPAVEQVILRCLEKDVELRPRSARAVALALPGGDPLAAALAAGETPRPELLAAAGSAEGMERRGAVLLLLSFLALLLLSVRIGENVGLPNHVGLAKPPQVLLDKAREIVTSFGYPDRPRDHAAWFGPDQRNLRFLGQEPDPTRRWRNLDHGPAALKYSYRQGPTPLYDSGQGLDLHHPPFDQPGMVELQLTPSGRLRDFRAIPEPNDPSPAREGAVGWAAFFQTAGLDPSRFQPIPANFTPPVYADALQSWDGVYPDREETPLRIEAATLRGWPVYFRAGPPSELLHDEPIEAQPILGVVLTALLLLGGLLLAWRNTRLGRGFPKGAVRVGVFVFLTRLMPWLLVLHQPHDPVAAFELMVRQVSYALFTGALTFVFYLALEPHVRRRWPDTIIPWTRLLTGRLRDPLVGRDLLVGGLWGLAAICLTGLRQLLPPLLGWPAERPPLGFLSPLMGMGPAVGRMLHLAGNGVLIAMILLFMLVGLRVLLRRTWVAEFLWFLLIAFGTAASMSGPLGPTAAASLLIAGSLLFLFVRFGLLAASVGIFLQSLLGAFPLTADPSSWYFPATAVAAGAALLLGLWGFRAVLASPDRSGLDASPPLPSA